VLSRDRAGDPAVKAVLVPYRVASETFALKGFTGPVTLLRLEPCGGGSRSFGPKPCLETASRSDLSADDADFAPDARLRRAVIGTTTPNPQATLDGHGLWPPGRGSRACNPWVGIVNLAVYLGHRLQGMVLGKNLPACVS